MSLHPVQPRFLLSQPSPRSTCYIMNATWSRFPFAVSFSYACTCTLGGVCTAPLCLAYGSHSYPRVGGGQCPLVMATLSIGGRPLGGGLNILQIAHQAAVLMRHNNALWVQAIARIARKNKKPCLLGYAGYLKARVYRGYGRLLVGYTAQCCMGLS